MLNAVGIDVSKGRSTVAVLQPGGVVIHKPFDISHKSSDLRDLARYTIDNWVSLREYSVMDTTRTELKTLNSQFTFFMKQKTAAKTNLIALLDMTYPGVNKLFTSPVRPDGSEKWVDYADSFWHVDCVLDSGQKMFTERYQSFCKRHGYDHQPERPEKLYAQAKELVPTAPKDPVYKEMIRDSIAQLNLMSKHVEELRRKMDELASSLPEYQTVRSMYGVGPSLGPQIMAEIEDISRFDHREALTAYAGVDPGKNDSGEVVHKSGHASKCGSARLRKALFQVMEAMLQLGPRDNDPVSQFLFKKKAEGKPYLVYMTAGANKFLRVYYGKVKECIRNLPAPGSED